jgi:diacylglycerol kinase (ATP)
VIPIILNPVARGSRARLVAAKLRAFQPAAEVHETRYAGHATELAAQLAQEGREIVVAVGGDGTVNEVLQGLARVNATRSDPTTHTALGVLPAGTMNVFAYEIGFPSHRDVETPWRVITSGQRRSIDLWQANDRYFVQLAGAGFDADVVRRTTSAMKQRYGPAAYAISGIASYLAPQSQLVIELPDGRTLTGAQVFFGNGRNYGGRFPLLRRARMDDGLLDALVLHGEVSPLHIAAALHSVATDHFEAHDSLTYVQAASLTIHGDERIALELDGELAGTAPVSIRLASFPLRVACE